MWSQFVFQSGKLRERFPYKKGRLEGMRIFYGEPNQLWHNIPYKEGIMHGTKIFFKWI